MTQNKKSLWLAIASGMSLFLVVASWALLVPPKSAPDDDFHLTSIWCAWGDSAYCIEGSSGSVRVPDQLVALNCRNFDFKQPDEKCDWQAPFTFTSTERFRPPNGYNSPLFYVVNRVFVDEDIAASTLRIRLFNSALLGIVFSAAMWVASPIIRRSLALTWMVAATPLVAFTVASTTPQSWTITSGALSWVFFASWLTHAPQELTRRVVSVLGLALTIILAASARSDAGLYVFASYLAVIVYYWSLRRNFGRRLLLVVVPAVIVTTIGFSYRASSLLVSGSDGSSSGAPNFPQADFVAMLSSLPAFFAGITGFFPASEVPWNSYVTWGLGWEGFPSPSFAYLTLLLALGGLIMWGIQSIASNRLIAIALLALAVVSAPILNVVVVYEFASGNQLRYFLPLVLALVGFLLLKPLTLEGSLTTPQLTLVAILTGIGSFVAFVSAAVRYQQGLTSLWDVAWARVWADESSSPLPGPSLLIFGLLALLLFVSSAVLQVRAAQEHSAKPLLRRRADPSRHPRP